MKAKTGFYIWLCGVIVMGLAVAALMSPPEGAKGIFCRIMFLVLLVAGFFIMSYGWRMRQFIIAKSRKIGPYCVQCEKCFEVFPTADTKIEDTPGGKILFRCPHCNGTKLRFVNREILDSKDSLMAEARLMGAVLQSKTEEELESELPGPDEILPMDARRSSSSFEMIIGRVRQCGLGTCETCISGYFTGTTLHHGPTIYQCRFSPPVGNKPSETGVDPIWPQVLSYHWCSHYQIHPEAEKAYFKELERHEQERQDQEEAGNQE